VKPISNGAGPIARTPQPNGHFEKLFEKDNEAFIIYDCKTKNGRWSWNTEFFTRDLPRKSRKRLNLFPANGAPVGRKRMSDQVTNKGDAEESQVRVDVALSSSTASSDTLLAELQLYSSYWSRAC